MFKTPSLPKILISGAGITGLSLARLLQTKGIPFKLIEKRPRFKLGNRNTMFLHANEGTGIALPANAVRALRYMGLGAAIERYAHPVNRIIATDPEGTVLNEASLLEPPLNIDRFVALHRHQLHTILCDGLIDTIQFDTYIEQLCHTHNGVLVKFNHSELPQEKFSAVIAAEGVYSHTRKLVFPANQLSDLGATIWRWTCSYPTENLQPTYMLGMRDLFMAYPIAKDEVYCYAHVCDPENSFAHNTDHHADLAKIFGHYGGIAQKMLAILPCNSLINLGRLQSVQPLFTRRNIAFIGDAGHACSPMLQQGAASGFEDAIVLAELLKHFPIAEALQHYEQVRKERINWISAASDGPLKMLIHATPQSLLATHDKIRKEGPLNVIGWRKLLAEDPIKEIAHYIATIQSADNTKSVGMTVK